MAFILQPSSSTTVSYALGDEAFIPADATVSGSGDAIITNSGDGTVRVANSGTVAAGTAAFDFNSLNGYLENDGTVTAFGNILDFSGDGTMRVVNSGTMTGDGTYGFDGLNSDGGAFSLYNTGVISTGGRFNYSNVLDTLEIVNHGDITIGSYIDADASSANRIVNTGTMVSETDDLILGGGAGVDLVNSGFMQAGPDVGDRVLSGTSAQDSVNNTGEMSGGLSLYGNNDSVVNSGTIFGDVDFYVGADAYDGNGGGIVSGTVLGGGGDDTLLGGSAADRLDGGDQADTIVGRGGDDVLAGDAGADALYGNAGDDEMTGGLGDDTVIGSGGNDTLQGGDQNDTLVGQQGDDGLQGDGGTDVLDGGAGVDDLVGGTGDDLLRGRDGDDFLTGENGRDVLTGGAGVDQFIYNAQSESSADAQRDVILDFEQDVDIISLVSVSPGVFDFRGTAGYTASGAPELRLQETQAGSTIVRADVDGDGATDMEINVAQVQGLTADDFVL